MAIIQYFVLFVILTVSAFTSNSAWPQDQALDEVVVTAVREEALQWQSPANISLLDETELKLVAAEHAQQLLSRVPGVVMQRGDGQESLPGIRSAVLTGAGACGSVLVMEESIPVRGAGFCNVNELFDTHFEQASRIEVVRGPGTALYGSNSLTGSVNVHLNVMRDDRFSIEFGEHGYRRGQGEFGYQTGATQGRFYLSVADDNGYRDHSGYSQQKLSWRQQGQLADWRYVAGLTATNLDQETAGYILGLDSYKDLTQVRQNPNPEAYRDSQSVRAWTRFEREFGGYELSITPYLRVSDMDFLLHFLPGKPLEQNQQKGWGWQSALQLVSDQATNWVIGFDAEFSEGALLQTQSVPTRGSSFLIETVPVGTHYDYQVDAQQLAVFSHVNWQPVNSDWRWIAGLRAELMRYDYDNLSLTGRTRDDGSACDFGGCRYSRPADREDNFFDVSPKLELQYAWTQNSRAFLRTTTSFRAPQATELYRLQRAQQVADLDSVRATNLELGYEQFGENLEFGMSVFQLSQRNVIFRDSDFFNTDGNTVRSKGIDLSLRYSLSSAWSVQVATSLAEHRYTSDQFSGDINIKGNELDTAPSLVANAAVNWRPTPNSQLELSMARVSDYFLDPENEHSYPGHNVFHLRGQWAVTNKLGLFAKVLNVADERYAERADYTSFSKERYFPGLPRSVFFGLEYQP